MKLQECMFYVSKIKGTWQCRCDGIKLHDISHQNMIYNGIHSKTRCWSVSK